MRHQLRQAFLQFLHHRLPLAVTLHEHDMPMLVGVEVFMRLTAGAARQALRNDVRGRVEPEALALARVRHPQYAGELPAPSGFIELELHGAAVAQGRVLLVEITVGPGVAGVAQVVADELAIDSSAGRDVPYLVAHGDAGIEGPEGEPPPSAERDPEDGGVSLIDLPGGPVWRDETGVSG